MERIVYRKTLDVQKNGIQFTLQGFETADNMARSIEISLMANGDTLDFPLEQTTAIMYVTTPNAMEPSINECTIKDNKIIYDVLPIVEEGITEMQLKIIGTRIDGAEGVLATPKFAIEVSQSNTNEEGATQSTTYTALENAIAKANGVYDSRLLRIELDVECNFKAYYADGSTYESDVLKELFLKGDVLLSESFAKGGTGIRAGEDTDNSKYYSNVSKSASAEASRVSNEATKLLEEVTQHGVYTTFAIDFEKGEVVYRSPKYNFSVDKETGELIVVGAVYSLEDEIANIQGQHDELRNEFDVSNKKLASICDYVIEENEDRYYVVNSEIATEPGYESETGYCITRYKKWLNGEIDIYGSFDSALQVALTQNGNIYTSRLSIPINIGLKYVHSLQVGINCAYLNAVTGNGCPVWVATQGIGKLNDVKCISILIASTTPITGQVFNVDFTIHGSYK